MSEKTYSMSMYASMEDLLTDKCKDQQESIQRLESDLDITANQRDELYLSSERTKQENAELRREVGRQHPWQEPPLNCWAICGMNHYHISGERYLFVSMTRNGKCITEEGKDGPDLWDRLRQKAIKGDR